MLSFHPCPTLSHSFGRVLTARAEAVNDYIAHTAKRSSYISRIHDGDTIDTGTLEHTGRMVLDWHKAQIEQEV